MRMWKPVVVCFCVLGLVACGSDEDVSGTSTSVPDASEDCFFCEDDAGMMPDVQLEDVDDGKDDVDYGKDDVDYGKDDVDYGKDDVDGKDALALWVGTFDVDALTGTYAFLKTSDFVALTPDCIITYSVENASDEPPCDNCSFAVRFSLGDVLDESAPEVCAAGAGLDGTELILGHGPEGDKGNVLYDMSTGVVKEAGNAVLDGSTWTTYIVPL